MNPSGYEPMPMASLRCPRCGMELDVNLLDGRDGGSSYAGVCTTPLLHGGRCGTVLRLEVTAHVFAISG